MITFSCGVHVVICMRGLTVPHISKLKPHTKKSCRHCGSEAIYRLSE